MASVPTLLYLHGVGTGDQDEAWRQPLDEALRRVGHPGLSGINVVAPKYPNTLKGVDDEVPMPKLSVRGMRGDEAERHRREFERRRTSMEALLGGDEQGKGYIGAEQMVPTAAKLDSFVQAKNFVTNRNIRAAVLQRILHQVPTSGRLVIVGHSLGSVIAADLLRRLPPKVQVSGLVTIGSPMAHETFAVDGLLASLAVPPANLAWWVNLWNPRDPVPAGRGASAVLPWVLDRRIESPIELKKKGVKALNPIRFHEAVTYLSNDRVAAAIGNGLFGYLSTTGGRRDRGVEVRPDFTETLALLGLRFAHLSLLQLDGDLEARYRDGVRHVQSTTFEQLRHRASEERRPMPSLVASLAVDLTEPDSQTPPPGVPLHLSISEAVVTLVTIATTNMLTPFEIEVPKGTGKAAMQQLTMEMELGSKVGANVFDAAEEARNALKGPTNWIKWTALGLGAAAMLAATGGLALAAAGPGLAGAAAITSALAAFGPGGMVGGLLTAGTLVTAGGSGIAIGLAAPSTSAATMEAVVATQLTTALLRGMQGLEQDPQTWNMLTEMELAVSTELSRLEPVSDESAPSLKELRRKRDAIARALAYLQRKSLGPRPLTLTAGDS